jgi:hypothetical protein
MKAIYMFAALLFCSSSIANEALKTPAPDSLAKSALIGTWTGEADFRGAPANICMVITQGPGSKHLVLKYKVNARENAKALFSGLGTYVLMPESRIEGSWLDSMNNHFQLKGLYSHAGADASSSMSVTWHSNGKAVGKSDYSTSNENKNLEITDSILDKSNAYKPFFKASLSRMQSVGCAD